MQTRSCFISLPCRPMLSMVLHTQQKGLCGAAIGEKNKMKLRDAFYKTSLLVRCLLVAHRILPFGPAGPLIIDSLTSNQAIRETAKSYLFWAVFDVAVSLREFPTRRSVLRCDQRSRDQKRNDRITCFLSRSSLVAVTSFWKSWALAGIGDFHGCEGRCFGRLLSAHRG